MRPVALFALMVLTLAGGCAGYRLGPTNGLRAGENPSSSTPSPTPPSSRASAKKSPAPSAKIQHDGTFRLDTAGGGDVIVNIEITRYARKYLALQRRDTLTARDYEINLYATVVAVDRASGREILRREVRGKTTTIAGSDLVSLERQSRPLLAENLAQTITDLLVDGEW